MSRIHELSTPKWPALGQDWPGESAVRIRTDLPAPEPVQTVVTRADISAYTPARARDDALERASEAASRALDLIGTAVDWLGVVDEKAAAHHEKAVAGVSSLADYLSARSR